MTDSASTYPIVLGTAGHIDHGKTALVKALTGIDTDRLKVEKERGITTELGFAHLDLGERRFGVVDVPGHERFIKSMVAGAGGLDLVCLVIAADEGIMPQTREHLDICELLGVRRGVVAITKSDLVEAEWLAMLSEELRAGLAGTFLENAELLPVSAKTGEGLDALKRELSRLAEQLPARADDGLFRMPLDRVFTIKGFGTVVTGTIFGGRVRTTDAVIAHPRAVAAKVRGIELHGSSVETARAGMRCALNLSGVSRDDLRRGDLLAHPDAIDASHIIDARFRYLKTSRGALGRRNRVLIHHGTSQLAASLVLVDRDHIAPGQEALVQLRLDIDTPLAALPGDRFIARGFVIQEHYGTTIGGGEILRVKAPKSRKSSARTTEAIEAIARASADERVALEILSADAAGMTTDTLGQRLGLSESDLGAAIARLVEAGDAVVAGAGPTALYVHAEPFARLEKRAVDELARFHDAHPERDAMSREQLRGTLAKALAPRMFDRLVEALVRRKAIVAERDQVRRAEARTTVSQANVDERDERVAGLYRGWGITPKRPKEVPGELGLDAKDVRAATDRLLAAGTLVRVKSDLYVDSGALAKLREKLVAHLDANGKITPAEWKSITGASRKFSIPLAEYFDTEKLTLRVGDVRKRRG